MPLGASPLYIRGKWHLLATWRYKGELDEYVPMSLFVGLDIKLADFGSICSELEHMPYRHISRFTLLGQIQCLYNGEAASGTPHAISRQYSNQP